MRARAAHVLTAALAFSWPAGAAAQPPEGSSIRVGPNVQVSVDLASVPHAEVIICAHASDARRMLAAALLYGGTRATSFQWDAAAFATADGGESWRRTLDMRGADAMSVDPSCAYGPDGAVYLAVMLRGAADPASSLAVVRSADGGRTWRQPVIAPGSLGVDRPFIAVDDTEGAYHGRVYVHAQLVSGQRTLDGDRLPRSMALFRSLDGGATFERPLRGLMTDLRSHTRPGGIAVLSDGTVVALYAESRPPAAGAGPPTRTLKAYGSSDGGETLKTAVTVAPIQGTGIPALAVDRASRSFKDRLYAVWEDSAAGVPVIHSAYSADGGRTWSAPVAVSDARPLPGFVPSVGLPAIAVNRAGIVGVVWYDDRESPGREGLHELGWNLRFSASLDGGETWLPSVRVDEYSAERRRAGEWIKATVLPRTFMGLPEGSAQWVSLRAFSLLHTVGLAADAAGTFHPVWVDARTGTAQAWTAAVTVSGAAFPHGSETLAGLDDVSDSVLLRLSRVWYDRANGTVSADAHLENVSDHAVGGPLYVRALALTGSISAVEAANADNGVTGSGAVWDFSQTLGGRRALAPGESTGARTLVFRLVDARQGAPRTVGLIGDLVHFKARVLGKARTGAASAGGTQR